MQEEKNEKNIFIPLLSSKAKIQEFSGYRYVLVESILHNNSEQASFNLDFKISNFRKILEDPLSSPSNLLLNEPFKMVTELENLEGTEVKLVFDTTMKKKQKIENLKKMELEGKDRIGVCYLPQFPNISKNDKEIDLILSSRRILKKIEHEAFDSDLCFSGIGVVRVSDLLDSGSFESKMFAGIKEFVKKHGSPVIIDMEYRDKEETVATWIESNIEEGIRSRFLLINFKLIFQNFSNFDQGQAKEGTTFDDYSSIKGYLSKGFNIQIKIFEFIRKNFTVETTSRIMKEFLSSGNQPLQYIDRIILTPGVEYKTDLAEYGGPGFSIINSVFSSLALEQGQKEKLFKGNLLNLFNWWVLKEIKESKGKTIKCTTCGYKGSEQDQWFSKNGLFFEKPACFKKYLKFLKEKGL